MPVCWPVVEVVDFWELGSEPKLRGEWMGWLPRRGTSEEPRPRGSGNLHVYTRWERLERLERRSGDTGSLEGVLDFFVPFIT